MSRNTLPNSLQTAFKIICTSCHTLPVRAFCFLLFFLQQLLLARSGRILALIPNKNAPSDDSEHSDDENELPEHASLSEFSSPAPSIASSLERLNLLESDDEVTTRENVCLTPIFQALRKFRTAEMYQHSVTYRLSQQHLQPQLQLNRQWIIRYLHFRFLHRLHCLHCLLHQQHPLRLRKPLLAAFLERQDPLVQM